MTTKRHEQATASQTVSVSDAEAISHLEQAIITGKHWFLALLEAMGLWVSAEETFNERTYRYLIDGEAFDWLLLAERLCQEVDGLLPADEKEAFLFHARPPFSLSPKEVKELIGSSKYRQYLNYFYGVTVEGTLLLAVQEEVKKERWPQGLGNEEKITDESFQRIYGANKAPLLKRFRQERGYPHLKSITLTELKEFTYWLFKFRLRQSEKAKVASDTKKALDYLRRQWVTRGFFGALATEDPAA
ncbi:hypothetical protein ACFLXF_02880 [Chloroflexota bacterium]